MFASFLDDAGGDQPAERAGERPLTGAERIDHAGLAERARRNVVGVPPALSPEVQEDPLGEPEVRLPF